MSAPKFTPGPWSLETVPTSMGTCHKIGPFPSRGFHSETHACVYADSVRRHDYGHCKVGDELLANARLIAAAPDLYAALLSLYDRRTDESMARARDALAKAVGRA